MTTLIPKHKQTATGAVNRSISQKLDEIPSLSDFDTNANYEAYALTLTQPVDHAVKPETVIRTLSSKLKDTISVLDFGAVADGSISTGTGTDNTAAFQLAITTLGVNGSLYVPEGVYMLHSQVTIPSGFNIVGAGSYQSVLCAKSTFNSDGIIKFNGAGGPPTSIQHLGIIAQQGGAGASSIGLNMQANGSYASNIWAGGFAESVVMTSSSSFFYDSVIDVGISAGKGLRVSYGASIVSNVQIYDNYVGAEITNATIDGPVTFDNVQFIDCDYAGLLVSSATAVQINNCSCLALSASKFNYVGLRLDTCSNVNITNFTGLVTSTTGLGIEIESSSSVTVSNSILTNWIKGIKARVSTEININGNICSGNKEQGIYVDGGGRVIISNNNCNSNGDVSASSAGITASNSASYGLFTLLGNTCSQEGGGVQKYGINVNLTDNGANSGFTNLVGNMAKFNTTANINTTGKVANISSTGNVV